MEVMKRIYLMEMMNFMFLMVFFFFFLAFHFLNKIGKNSIFYPREKHGNNSRNK